LIFVGRLTFDHRLGFTLVQKNRFEALLQGLTIQHNEKRQNKLLLGIPCAGNKKDQP